MLKKSVYLFSIAVLGVACFPTASLASEASVDETGQSNVTAEFVEAPAIVEETEVLPAEIEPTIEPTEETAAVEEVPVIETSETLNNSNLEEVAEQPKEIAESEISSDTLTEPESQNAPSAELTQIENFAAKEARSSGYLDTNNDGKIVDHEKAITDENASITSDYNFMPNFDEVTDFEVTGNYTEGSSSFAFDLNSQTGAITVTYKNVGSYNGKAIDMKITVKNWEILPGSYYSHIPKLTIYKKNGLSLQGIKNVTMGYSFLDNLTSSPVELSGFFNFTDIDLRQSIDIFDNCNVENFYVLKDNKLYYKVNAGYIKIGEIDNNNTRDTDMRNWLTYTYKNVSSFDIRYNQEEETGAFFSYTYQAPVVIEEPKPEPKPEPAPTPEEPKKPELTEETPEEVKVVPNVVTVSAPQPQTVAKAEPKVISLGEKQEVKKIVEVKQSVLPHTGESATSWLAMLGSLILLVLSASSLKKEKLFKK